MTAHLQKFLPGRSGVARWAAQTAVSAWALAWLLLAAGCGPGVGGTGTGHEPQLARFGATAASVCNSALVSQLSCTPPLTASGVVDMAGMPVSPGSAGTASLPADTGTEAVRLADAAQRVLALLQANRIELNAPCLGLRFDGDWGVVLGQAPRFYGWAQSSAYTGPAVLEASLNGSGLSLRLLDENARLLFGPVSLIRSTAVQAASCN